MGIGTVIGMIYFVFVSIDFFNREPTGGKMSYTRFGGDNLYGQYIPGNSILHRLLPSGKLLCFFLILTGVIATNTIHSYLYFGTVILGISLLSGLPWTTIIGSFLRIWRFLLLIFLMNAFFYDNSQVIWSWWIMHLSICGILQGANVMLHVIYLMLLSNILLATTPPQEITNAMTSLLKPLALFHVPVGEISIILSAALQFIPTLSAETDMIKKAQIARGARFESPNPIQRVYSYLPLLVPIFLSAFRRADELAMAMESRGYLSGHACLPDAISMPIKDWFALAASIIICVIPFTIFS